MPERPPEPVQLQQAEGRGLDTDEAALISLLVEE